MRDVPPPDPSGYQEPKPGKAGIYDLPYLVEMLEEELTAARLNAAHWKMLHDKRTKERNDANQLLSEIKNGDPRVRSNA